MIAALRLRAVLPRESARGPRPSRASFEPGGVYAGFAAISSEGSLPPEKKLLPCSFRARKCAAFQRKLEGVAVAGEILPRHLIIVIFPRARFTGFTRSRI